MAKEKLIEIITKLLNTDSNLDFLSQLKTSDIETLIACIRGRVDQFPE
jgi:hypothetical protein